MWFLSGMQSGDISIWHTESPWKLNSWTGKNTNKGHNLKTIKKLILQSKRLAIILVLAKSWNKNHNLLTLIITLQNVKDSSGVCLANDYGYSCSGLFNLPFCLFDLSINTLLQKLMESDHCAVSELDVLMVAQPNRLLGKKKNAEFRNVFFAFLLGEIRKSWLNWAQRMWV